MGQGILRWDGAKYWPKTECADYSQFQLREGDVILAMDRPWIEAGLKYAWVRSSDLPCLLVQRVARMRGLNGLSTDYLRYVIGSREFTGHVKSITTGVNVPHISGRDIKRFRFLMPPTAQQSRIVSILRAYDDLIEVNRRRIAVLEEMARRLFDEWFALLRFPGYETGAPVNGPPGPIPAGWRVSRVQELVERRRNGRVYKENDCEPEGQIVVIDQSSNELLGYHSNEPDHHATPDDPIAIFGDHTCKMRLLVSPFSLGPNTVAFKAKAPLNIYYLFALIRGLTQTREYKRHWNELMSKEVLVASTALGALYAQM